MHSELLDTKETARILGLRKQSLEKWRLTGRGPRFIKVGRRVAYRRADIEEWLDGRVVHSTAAGFALDAPESNVL